LSATQEDVLSALVNLGYQKPVAEKAIERLGKDGAGRSFDALFREALAAISK
jgi:Holliday junction DNA helicase RuvA